MTDDPTNIVPIKRKRPGGRTPAGRGNGVGKGDGWGGPARGDAAICGNEILIPGQGPEKRALTAMRAEKSEDLTRRMREVIVAIADDEAQPGNVRLTAAVAMLNRDEGMPVARTVGVLDANVKGISVQFVQPMEIEDEGDGS